MTRGFGDCGVRARVDAAGCTITVELGPGLASGVPVPFAARGVMHSIPVDFAPGHGTRAVADRIVMSARSAAARFVVDARRAVADRVVVNARSAAAARFVVNARATAAARFVMDARTAAAARLVAA